MNSPPVPRSLAIHFSVLKFFCPILVPAWNIAAAPRAWVSDHRESLHGAAFFNPEESGCISLDLYSVIKIASVPPRHELSLNRIF